MSKKSSNQDFYQMERFNTAQLKKMENNILDYAAAIDGLPKDHSEALTKRGWMTPFLLAYDDLLWGRWDYWGKIWEKKTIKGSGPIPQIKWADLGSPGVLQTRKMLTKCLDHHESNIDTFADWLLWAMGNTKDTPNISPTLNKHYYENFDLFLVLNYPTDYLSQCLSEQTGKGYKGALGYYPTPFHVVQLMSEMTLAGEESEKLKKMTVMDPCVGCGAMLLPASNYYLRGYGADISGIAVRLCKIQMLWYAPWYARANDAIQGFDAKTEPVQLSLEGLWKIA